MERYIRHVPAVERSYVGGTLENGNPTRTDGGVEIHPLVVRFEPGTQMVSLQFNTGHFKTWEFVLAVLEMAKLHAEKCLKAQLIQSMQQQAADQALAARVNENLKRRI